MKKNNKNILNIVFGILYFLPGLTYAQSQGLGSALISLRSLLNSAIPLLIALGVVYFMYGLGKFILNDAGNEKTREDGKQKMLWGVIALFVMVSILGIINWLSNTLSINPSSNIPFIQLI